MNAPLNPGAKCDSCTNCLLFDYGYSNWTVEGTTVLCMLKKHPDKEFDRWFGEDSRLSFAERCDNYISGEPEWLDVDGENWGELSDQAKAFVEEARS